MKKLTNRKGEVWLNVASGFYTLEDYINIDNSLFLKLSKLSPFINLCLSRERKQWVDKYVEARKKHVIIRANCKRSLPFQPNSVDHILCSHFLEHLYYKDTIEVVKGFYKILKVGATLHIIVPDLKVRAKEYLKKEDSKDAANDFIESLIFNRKDKPSLLVRLMEVKGDFGLFHRWMYDKNSMSEILKQNGFEILETNTSPSKDWRKEDDALQVNIIARKK